MQQIVEIIGHIEEREPSLDDALPLVLSQYLNEKCKYCGKPFLTLSDLDTSVWVGYNEHGRIAHKSCYETEVESLAVPTLILKPIYAYPEPTIEPTRSTKGNNYE